MRFEKKVAIITGGSRGIGYSTAETFLREGAKVIITASSKENADKAANKLKEKYPDAVVEGISPNLSSFEDVKKEFDKIVAKYGCVDILVNNAGFSTKNNTIFQMTKFEDIDYVMNVNFTATMKLTQQVLKFMIRQKGGSIINVSSVSGIIGNAGQANYSAAKAGLLGFTKSLAKELACRSITVNAIAPGFIATQMTKELNETIVEQAKKLIPLKRFGEAEEIANMAIFLASDEAQYITGQVIKVDGGMVM